MNKEYKEIWYEVFISDEHGSITIENFNTLKEAKSYRVQFIKENPDMRGKIWIDKWGSKEKYGQPEQLEHCSI